MPHPSRAAGLLATLSFVVTPAAALSFDEALHLALTQSPALQAQQAALAAAEAARGAAASLPAPRLTLGVENLPTSGEARYALNRDAMTMQRIALTQELPNHAKRRARSQGAQARSEREQAHLAGLRLQLHQALVLAWQAQQFNARRQALLAELMQENQQLQNTLLARVGSGSAAAAELLLARQQALALADRQDALLSEAGKARATLQSLVGPRAAEPLQGDAPLALHSAEHIRSRLAEHAELASYAAQLAMAQAELGEAQADQQGDWSWGLAYARRGAQYGDMVSLQISVDLPWQQQGRQQPLIQARQLDAQRVEAQRAELLRQLSQQVEEQLADLQALERQRERLQTSGLGLARQQVSLALAAYQAGRGELSALLSSRRELLETQLRAIDLDALVCALRARLNHLSLE